LKKWFGKAEIAPAASNTPARQWAEAVVAVVENGAEASKIPLDIPGTSFQRTVWQALRGIPRGQTRSYQAVAAAIGRPAACRAVAGACGKNPVALIIPCHRVIREDGGLGGFYWGIERKKQLLDMEKAGGQPIGREAVS